MRKTALKLIISAVLIGLAIEAPFIGINLYRDEVSGRRLFKSIEVGQTASSAKERIRLSGRYCNPGREGLCSFSDYWNEYIVVFDENTNSVASKTLIRKNRAGLSRWILRTS